MLHRHDLTDAEWARVEPLLPDQTPRRGGGRWADHRMVLNGMLWRTRCGVPWRDVRPSFGNWKTIANRAPRWSSDGTLAGILDELRRGADGAKGAGWTVGVDSGVVRAHQHAAGARHAAPADIPVEVVATTRLDTGGGLNGKNSAGKPDEPGEPGAGPIGRRSGGPGVG